MSKETIMVKTATGKELTVSKAHYEANKDAYTPIEKRSAPSKPAAAAKKPAPAAAAKK